MGKLNNRPRDLVVRGVCVALAVLVAGLRVRAEGPGWLLTVAAPGLAVLAGTELVIASARRSLIRRAPGAQALRALDFFFAPQTFEHLSQIILDMRIEHAEALLAGQTWKARWVCVRGYWCLASALRSTAVGGFIRTIAATLRAGS